MFFTLTIAQRTYIQKIGDAADMAPTAAVSFTINHIMAVFIPVTFGLIWTASPAYVFLLGVGIASSSLILAFLVPHDPGPGAKPSGANPNSASPRRNDATRNGCPNPRNRLASAQRTRSSAG